jgi:hypothetical protein
VSIVAAPYPNASGGIVAVVHAELSVSYRQPRTTIDVSVVATAEALCVSSVDRTIVPDEDAVGASNR